VFQLIYSGVVLALVAMGFVLSFVMGEALSSHWYLREDGLIESLTAAALFATCVLCLVRVWRLRTLKSSAF